MQLCVVVLGDDLHHVLLLKGVLIHPLHCTHTLNRDGGAHLQRFRHKQLSQLLPAASVAAAAVSRQSGSKRVAVGPGTKVNLVHPFYHYSKVMQNDQQFGREPVGEAAVAWIQGYFQV